METKTEQIVLKNVRVKYAKLIRPGQAFDEGQPDLWSVNMYVTPEDAAKLKAHGAEPKTDKDGVPFYVAKRNTLSKKRETVHPPALVDGHKKPFDSELGNGSVANIAVTPFPWTKGARSGVLLYLNAVQVVNHVPMSAGVDAFEMIEGDPGADGEVNDLPF